MRIISRAVYSLVLVATITVLTSLASAQADGEKTTAQSETDAPKRASAIFAGGCFWCVETDFEKLDGVVDVVSGYSGGRSKEPNYQNYASGGHREVVFVMYDPNQITYAGLVEYLIKHIDPTNRGGQFNDVGFQYSPAVYYENPEEKESAERVIKALNEMKVYRGSIGVAVVPREPFWPAEDYHQDYHSKNVIKYNYFRLSSGRDAFVQRHWGTRAQILELPGAYPEGKSPAEIASENRSSPKPWLAFQKPKPVDLRKKLTPIQYKVTQQDGTEPAFRNDYWDNKKEGIYVDVVSGAPLFTSLDKYDSKTGWPSFVAPIAPEVVKFKQDRSLFLALRIEVRSQYGDSHLGHVFDDGPPERGGKRYCMNSAALRFIPKDEMESEGYGEFLKLFDGLAAKE